MNYKLLLITACALFLPLTATAQKPAEKIDSIRAKIPGTAFEHLLQKRRIAKRFEHKRFSDRLFFEAAITPNIIPTKEKARFSAMGHFAVGDWLTPEHAWRVSAGAGFYNTGEVKTKTLQLAGDYLINITAIGQPVYDKRKPLELLGVAGVDVMVSHKSDDTKAGIGIHAGLRGQAALGRTGYVFIEPRVGLATDDAVMMPSEYGIRGVASVSAGLGLRKPGETERPQSDPYTTSGHFLDNTFFSFAAGGGAILSSTPSQWKHYAGPTAAMSVGKWFTPLHALRVSAKAEAFKQQGEGRNKAFGLSAEYMFNIYSAMTGYREDDPFAIHLLGGLSYNVSKTSPYGHHTSPGMGMGLQTAFRLGKGVELFLEPRIDAYSKNYAKMTSSANGVDLTSAVLMGLNIRQGLDTRQQREKNDDFEQKSAYDHMFLEGAAGFVLPGTEHGLCNADRLIQPKAYAAVGKWFTPTSGIRLWGEAQQLKASTRSNRLKSLAVGADYLWNATNTFHGYRSDRPVELISGLGFNFATRSGSKRVFPGMNASIQALWNAFPMAGFYIQPTLRAYGDDFLRQSSNFTKLDYTVSLLAGVQLRLSGYRPASAQAAYEEEGAEGSISISGGFAAQGTGAAYTSLWGETGRLSYTRSASPMTAWRTSLAGYHNKLHGKQYAKIAAEGDYMVDLTALGLGYDPDRSLKLSAFAGLGIGADYTGQKARFAPDLHGGLQLAMRLTPQISAFVEPRLGYECSSAYKGGRLPRIQSSAQLGLSYHFKARTSKAEVNENPKFASFVSVALGTGAYTGSVTSMSPMRRKYTFVSDVALGHWVNSQAGYIIGLSSTAVQRRGEGNEWLTSVHADYMVNLRTLFTEIPDEDNPLRFSAALGANLTFAKKKSFDKTRVAPGLQASVEAGWRFNSGLEVFVRPQGVVYAKSIAKSTQHPAEGELRLLIGTKWAF